MTPTVGSNPFDVFFDFMRAFTSIGIAGPDRLNQSILPGWSFISVNESNSTAPGTEQAVVAKASYGKQLGRIMDALDVVITATPPPLPGEEHQKDRDAIDDFKALVEEVRKVKDQAAAARVARMISDLESVEAKNPDEFDRRCEALAKFLAGTEARRKSKASQSQQPT